MREVSRSLKIKPKAFHNSTGNYVLKLPIIRCDPSDIKNNQLLS